MFPFITRFIIVVSISLGASLFVCQGFASTVYTPGVTIGMTGSNTESRFDVHEVLYSTIGDSSYSPILNTTTRTFSGAFYVQTLGWITFNTGSYQVTLNCGAQSLSNITNNCQLSGTGWSEMVGEINFRAIQYLPSTGILSGSIQTYAGDFSLSGIFLPIRPAVFQENINTLRANTQLPLSISGVQQYAGATWAMQYTPKIQPFTQSIGGSTGTFLADISYAEDYTFTITDPDGGSTILDGKVLPGEVDISSFDSSNNYIHQFCSTFPGNCPDGNTPIPTTKTQNGNNIVADGNNTYQITIKPRDRFGNRVYTGSVTISYDTTASSVQIPGDTLGPVGWVSSFTGDALIISGQTFFPDFLNHWTTSPIQLTGQNIFYTIASVVPTDATHQVVLKDITYTRSDGSKIVSTDTTPLEFIPAFDSSIVPPPSIKIGEDSIFQVNTTKNTSLSFTPYIISAFSIGNGANASFQNFQSNTSIVCEAHTPMIGYTGTCDWIESQSFWYPSIASIHSSSTSYSITGSYIATSVDPPEESVSYANYIHYKKSDLGTLVGYLGSDDIVYLNQSGNLGNSKQEQSKVAIFGQNTSKRHDGVTPSKSERAKFLDTIRKNVAIFSRNRTTYSDVPYGIHQGNISINDSDFTSKKTIVTVGGDVTISSNIAAHASPIAIVALADAAGNGGNIIIAPTVTDIHASLVADRSIKSSGDYQLYIHGSVISGNTFGGATTLTCPYYINTVCDKTEASKHDMEKLRTFDGTTIARQANAPIARQHLENAIVIEYDMGLESNPPPILY